MCRVRNSKGAQSWAGEKLPAEAGVCFTRVCKPQEIPSAPACLLNIIYKMCIGKSIVWNKRHRSLVCFCMVFAMELALRGQGKAVAVPSCRI